MENNFDSEKARKGGEAFTLNDTLNYMLEQLDIPKKPRPAVSHLPF